MNPGRTESETRAEVNLMIVGDRGDVTTQDDDIGGGAGSTSRMVVGRTSTSNAPMFLHPEDVRSLIPEFVPEKVVLEKWLRRIDGLASLYGWDERAVCTSLCHNATGIGIKNVV